MNLHLQLVCAQPPLARIAVCCLLDLIWASPCLDASGARAGVRVWELQQEVRLSRERGSHECTVHPLVSDGTGR